MRCWDVEEERTERGERREGRGERREEGKKTKK
jgi:hypothetical protein